MRERIEDSGSLGVAMREDSTLGIIDALLKDKKATPDQIINALCNQKVQYHIVLQYLLRYLFGTSAARL